MLLLVYYQELTARDEDGDEKPNAIKHVTQFRRQILLLFNIDYSLLKKFIMHTM